MKKIVKEFALFFLFSGIAIKVSSSDKICEAEPWFCIKLTSPNPYHYEQTHPTNEAFHISTALLNGRKLVMGKTLGKLDEDVMELRHFDIWHKVSF